MAPKYWYVLIFIVSFLLGIYLISNFFDNFTNEQPDLTGLVTSSPQAEEESVVEEDIYSDPFQNSSLLHWDHMPITYRIASGCPVWQDNLTRIGFDKIQNETDGIVRFQEINASADIEIDCTRSRDDDGNFIRLAYAQILETEGNVIKKGKININGGQKCGTGYPALEVHEMLHLFDIGHNPLSKSIMSPVSSETTKSCKITKIDDEYVSCLKNIYSGGEIEGSCNFSSYTQQEIQDLPEPTCPSGYYISTDKSGCCPKPNMTVSGEYCVE